MRVLSLLLLMSALSSSVGIDELKKSPLKLEAHEHKEIKTDEVPHQAETSRRALTMEREASRTALIAKQGEVDASSRALTAEKELVAKALVAKDGASMRDLKQEREATARALIDRDQARMQDLKVEREITAKVLVEKYDAQPSTTVLTMERQTAARALIAKDKALTRDLTTQREVTARALIAKEEALMRDLTAEREVTARALIQKDESRQIASVAKEHRKQQALFIDTMCHEIRNPINGIIGTVSIVRDQITSMEQQIQDGDSQRLSSLIDGFKKLREYINDIEECANHQRVIANDVLSFSTLEQERLRLENTPMNLSHLLRQILHPYELILANKGITMEVTLFETEVHILGDQNRLKQIICNLLNNAIKFTPSGFIRVSALLRGKNNENQEVFEIRIEDSGIGMTEEETSRLFTPYAQANQGISSQYGGTGLGLVISQELAKLMHGYIAITSKKGIGTEFRLLFASQMISSEEYLQLSAPSPMILTTALPDPAPTIRILIVEDNLINQKVLVKILGKAGYIVDVANNGLEGLNLYKLHRHKIILMDIQMPVMDGLEATTRIRELETAEKFIPSYIICVSGNAREEHKTEALSRGVNAYLVKPFNREELIDLITMASPQLLR